MTTATEAILPEMQGQDDEFERMQALLEEKPNYVPGYDNLVGLVWRLRDAGYEGLADYVTESYALPKDSY